VNGRSFSVTTQREISNVPWAAAGTDVVLEATGAFRKREQAQQHIDAGAKKVLMAAPGKNALDGDFVIGVNDGQYDAEQHHIISIGSCTTNCLAPVAKVLHEEFNILRGFMVTTHAYTSTQNLLDGPHKDLRRARSAAENIIPTSTGAAKAIGLVIPELQGRLDGMAIRVPVPCGSLVDLTCDVECATSVGEINAAMSERAEGSMAAVLQIADAPLVSRDVLGNPHSSVFSPQDTMVKDGTFVKVLAWYDNEWGFSNRVVDMLQRMV